jgi:hypothetical protein
MTRAVRKTLIGKWRIVEMELWDTDYLDLVEHAYIRFERGGSGEFVFGVVTGGLDCDYTGKGVDFTWQGHNEMDEASGDGWAELEDNGNLTGEIKIHLSDESTFKARRW